MSKNVNKSNRVLNFMGKNCFECSLSILIVAPNRFQAPLRAALEGKHASVGGGQQLSLFTTNRINELLKLQSYIHFDFIVFVIDTLKNKALKSLDSELHLIDLTYVKTGRVCVVRPKDVSFDASTVECDELNSWANNHHIPLLHGLIMKEAKCLELAEQLLNLIIRTCGYNTGIPMSLGHTTKELDYLQAVFPDYQSFDLFND